jgi:hypothetical protein
MYCGEIEVKTGIGSPELYHVIIVSDGDKLLSIVKKKRYTGSSYQP